MYARSLEPGGRLTQYSIILDYKMKTTLNSGSGKRVTRKRPSPFKMTPRAEKIWKNEKLPTNLRLLQNSARSIHPPSSKGPPLKLVVCNIITLRVVITNRQRRFFAKQASFTWRSSHKYSTVLVRVKNWRSYLFGHFGNWVKTFSNLALFALHRSLC